MAVRGRVSDRGDGHHQKVDGTVTAGFEPVRDAFVDNFAKRGELGGAVCMVVATRWSWIQQRW